MSEKFDFSGYVTKNDVRCADNRIIRHDAFKQSDHQYVPLVWQHNAKDDPGNVIGKILLENRNDGVWGNGMFNKNPKALTAKEAVMHGDITSMSIHATRVIQKGPDVIHGKIVEVSLVLSGANDLAKIENPVIMHSDDGEPIYDDEEAIIYTNEPIIVHSDEDIDDSSNDSDISNKEIEHADSEETIGDVLDSMNDEQLEAIAFLIDASTDKEALEESLKDVDHSDIEGGRTIEDVINSMNDNQKKVANYLIDLAKDSISEVEHSDKDDEEDSENNEETETDNVDNESTDDNEDTNNESADDDSEDSEKSKDKNIKHSEGGDVEMKKNVFDRAANEVTENNVLTHDELTAIMNDAVRLGSLKESVLQHGIEDIDILFPEAKAVRNTPDMITRPMDWVSEVWNATHKSPFSRIKSVAANLTLDDARAKGYIKGNKKIEEQFGLLKRVTTPQTVYKKQKLDRDDIIDIVDFDVVAWLKAEMRMMLNEELARAILVGDGRSNVAEDKIKEDFIRPIARDEDLYTIKYEIEYPDDADVTDISNALVDGAIRSRKEYRGSGSPALYASTDVITDMMLARDKIGHRMYKTRQELADALNVSKIVEVPVMEGQTREDSEGNNFELLGVIVNLSDYTVGADKGGAVSFFDDFDIDYNKYTYLIETRCSGALTKPYSAIALEKKVALTTGD